VIVIETISREFRVALPWELLYDDDLAVIAETEEELIKRLNDWKDNVESKGMRVSMNKTKVMISGERHKVRQKAVRWPCWVCSKGVGSNSSGTGQPGSPRPKAVKRLCVCVLYGMMGVMRHIVQVDTRLLRLVPEAYSRCTHRVIAT